MTKKYYVKADYVPKKCGYLTAGKEYEGEVIGLLITDDEGDKIIINITECAHLGDNPWTLIEKEGKK